MLLITCAGVGVTLVCYVLVVKDRLPKRFPRPECRRSSWAWSLFFWAVLAFMGAYLQAGLVETDETSWAAMVGALTLAALLSLWRVPIRRFLGRYPRILGKSRSWLIEIIMLVLGAYLTFIAIEMPSNPNLTSFNTYGMSVEIFVCFLMITIFYLLFQRKGTGCALAVSLLFTAGIVEYFIVSFRGEPLMASDIFALGTAAAVSGSYTYVLDVRCVRALALVCAIVLMFSLMPQVPKLSRRRVVVHALLALALIVGGAYGAITFDITETFGIVVGGWNPLASYRRQGFLTSLIISAQDIIPSYPSGYSNDAAQDIIESYVRAYDADEGQSESRIAATEQFESLQPSVVVIMNETFSDMSIYNELHAGYTGPEWLNSFDETLLKGNLYVSAYGGGTCNSEFEFLTGTSMAFFGSGVYPYMVYDLSGVENLASQFKEMGYTTTAMHPNRAANWNRNIVYEDLGFDTFLDITDFTSAERIRGKVSDEATYDTILEILRTDDSPQFIFDVTMQNHSSYDTGLLSEDELTHYFVDGVNDPELDEFLALIDISDAALEDFIRQVSWMSRPVVVIFFGDHQPKIASAYNNLIYSDEGDTVEHNERRYQSSYMVWANYDVAGVDSGSLGISSKTSTNYLAAQVLEMIGAPLTDYQKCQLRIRQEMPVINLAGYRDKRGYWATAQDPSGNNIEDVRNDLWFAQYYQLFGNGVTYQVGAGAAGIL